MSSNNDDIGKLLDEYKAQKDNKEKRESQPLEPPKKREELIDFSKKKEKSIKIKLKKKTAKPKKSPEEKKAIKAERKGKAKVLVKRIFSKKVLLPVLSVIIIVAVGFAVKYGIDYSRVAYLTQYQEAYPEVSFPEGILEKLCDEYGKNQDTAGALTIDDINLNEIITSKNSAPVTDGASRFNYALFLDTNELEGIYSTADGYNNASKTIYYSTLFEEYTFQVVAAFYTNTKADDDDGYIFPYNVTEKMTVKSTNEYIDRINSRALYNVSNLQITRQDALLTISCPTEYKKDYRFVIVCKAVDAVKDNSTATDKAKVRKTQSEYTQLNEENPYRFASKWYPEIIITDNNGKESILKKTIDDYK